jgi:SAM-dependent methyltransferase
MDKSPSSGHTSGMSFAGESTDFGWISSGYIQARGGQERVSAITALIDRHLCREGTVLDIGTGPGEIAARLMTASRTVVGVDIAPEMARLAAKVLDGRAYEADAECLPFEAGSFDGAIAVWVLNHVANPARALAEVHRVLRPGGRMFYLSGIPSHPAWDRIGVRLQQLDVLRSAQVDREHRIVSLADSLGLRPVLTGQLVVKFKQRPRGLAERIENRSYGHLRGLDEETWRRVVLPVVEGLGRMPGPDRHRNRQNNHAFAVFEKNGAE